MNQPSPVRPSAPLPGPPATATTSRDTADLSRIRREVAALVDRVDEIQRVGSDEQHAGVVADLSTLETQADLLGQAHDILTGTLEQLDRL